MSSALSELQRLFLMPKPRLIEGEQRFEANINTQALVRLVMGPSDLYRRVADAQRVVTGALPRVGRGEVAAFVRQAILHVRNREFGKAEALLVQALEKHPNDRDLTGVLGLVYKAWNPRRATDARERFRRAWQLKSSDERMYRHWSQMEIQEGEWRRASEAAENGLKFIAGSRVLLYLAGYSKSRLGKELKASLQRDRARQELLKAQEQLEAALRTPDPSAAGERTMDADIYRALVLNCEALDDVRGVSRFFDLWLQACPDDPDAESEWERLSVKLRLSRE